MTLPVETYRKRRDRIAHAIGPGALLVVPGAELIRRNGSVHYPFRQESDFLYLGGPQIPDMILVVEGGSGRSTLLSRNESAEELLRSGPRLAPADLKERYGIDEVVLGEFPALATGVLREILAGRHTVFAPPADASPQTSLGRLVLVEIERWRKRGGKSGRNRIWMNGPYTIGEMRLVKDDAEIALIARAAELSAVAHAALADIVRPGMTECAIAAEIEHLFRRAGGDPLGAYPPIVAAGANACTLHHRPTDRTLARGELVLVDAGGECEGYAADITRVYAADGTFSPEQAAIYGIVLEAQEDALRFARPGNTLGDIHAMAAFTISAGLERLGIIDDAPTRALEGGRYRPFFPHGVGHWLGLDVHDAGDYRFDPVTQRSTRPLAPGMVITVEPGIYIPPDMAGVDPRWRGIGVRIEDDVLITEDGHRVLTSRAPKSLAALAGGPFPF